MEWVLVEDLYRRHSRSVYRRACALMGDRDVGKDVMQEVFLRASIARVEFRTAASTLSWLYRITTNICLNRLRDTRRHLNLSSLKQALSADERFASPTVEAVMTAQTLLDRVPDDILRIALYYFVDEMSQGEISLLLSIPRRTIGYRLEQFRTMTLAAV